MFHSLLGLLQKLAAPRVITTLVALWLLLAAAFQFTGATMRSYSACHGPEGKGYGSLDGKIVYTPDLAKDMLGAYGAEGRMFYSRVEGTVDLVFPLTNALLTSLLLLACGRALLRNSTPLRVIALLPFVGMVADYLENTLVLWMLASFPADISGVAQVSAVVSVTKSVFYVPPGVIALISLLVTGAVRLFAWIRSRK
ncbi:MAG: hypothetical protein QOH93_846 [Chloroflexia bacterium]|jgi:hypothetical protein|nr:hypothetical protein [Chloroflexia bacterium]